MEDISVQLQHNASEVQKGQTKVNIKLGKTFDVEKLAPCNITT